MSSSLGFFGSQISGHLFTLTGSYDALATVTVPSGGASSITFSAIPQTGYKHLQIRGIAQNTSGTDAYIQLNGTNTSYRHQLYGGGSTATASANSGIGYIIFTPSTGSPFGASITDILDYGNTNKVKTIRTLSGYDLNGSGGVGIGSALWNDTSAVNSITIVSAGTNFAQYSSFALYGVK